jgi:hypothetical protein
LRLCRGKLVQKQPYIKVFKWGAEHSSTWTHLLRLERACDTTTGY